MHITQDTTLVDTISQPQLAKTITVSEGVSFNYLIVLSQQAEFDLTVRCTGKHAHAKINILCLGTSTARIKHTTLVSLDADHAQADVYMLSLLKDGSDVQIHGNVTLSPDVSKVSGHLLEENIILGEKIKLRTAPILDVRSSDVSASHGCRVERLDPKRLFYMQSRGLTSAQSQALILDGYLNSMFEGFELDEIKIQEIKQLIIES